MIYQTDSSFFKFRKPNDWVKLPLYKKINYYKTVLNQYYSPYVDKLLAKQIVKEICGDELKIAKVIRILNGPNDLFQSDLNPDHIIKATHGSGWNINITSNTDLNTSKKLLHSWNIPYMQHNEQQYCEQQHKQK